MDPKDAITTNEEGESSPKTPSLAEIQADITARANKTVSWMYHDGK